MFFPTAFIYLLVFWLALLYQLKSKERARTTERWRKNNKAKKKKKIYKNIHTFSQTKTISKSSSIRRTSFIQKNTPHIIHIYFFNIPFSNVSPIPVLSILLYTSHKPIQIFLFHLPLYSPPNYAGINLKIHISIKVESDVLGRDRLSTSVLPRVARAAPWRGTHYWFAGERRKWTTRARIRGNTLWWWWWWLMCSW